MEKDQHQSLLEAISTPEPILVVDDDTDVLQMIQWVLEDLKNPLTRIDKLS